jgi:hypothetical protein
VFELQVHFYQTIASFIPRGYFDPMKLTVLREAQFVTNTKGQRVGVLLDLTTYHRLRGAEEELADVRTYDAARPKVTADLNAGRFTTLADYRHRRSSKRK